MNGKRAHSAMVKSSSIDACWARSAVAGKSTAGHTKITSKTSSMPTAAAMCNFESTVLIIHPVHPADAPLMQRIRMIQKDLSGPAEPAEGQRERDSAPQQQNQQATRLGTQ